MWMERNYKRIGGRGRRVAAAVAARAAIRLPSASKTARKSIYLFYSKQKCVCVCVGMKANIKIMNKVRWANLFYINSWMFVTTINIVDMFFNFLLSVSTYVWVILYMHVQKWLNISFGYTDSYWRLSVFQFRIWSTNFTKFVLRL